MRIISYCLMPNHWHLLLWPELDQTLSRFVGWLTQTHAQRWRKNRGSVGAGHLYQGRFKSFPVQLGEYYYKAGRYVERNALKANLVDRAEDWRWGSLWVRCFGSARDKALLTEGPMQSPADWLTRVNHPESEAEFEALREAIRRGRPFGSEEWSLRIARELGIESTIRPRGRPKKGSDPFLDQVGS
jgi:putative transposase